MKTTKAPLTARPAGQEIRAHESVRGPSLFEIEYLRQLREELELFLRSRHFGTIESLEIAIAGQGYQGSLKVSA